MSGCFFLKEYPPVARLLRRLAHSRCEKKPHLKNRRQTLLLLTAWLVAETGCANKGRPRFKVYDDKVGPHLLTFVFWARKSVNFGYFLFYKCFMVEMQSTDLCTANVCRLIWQAPLTSLQQTVGRCALGHFRSTADAGRSCVLLQKQRLLQGCILHGLRLQARSRQLQGKPR